MLAAKLSATKSANEILQMELAEDESNSQHSFTEYTDDDKEDADRIIIYNDDNDDNDDDDGDDDDEDDGEDDGDAIIVNEEDLIEVDGSLLTDNDEQVITVAVSEDRDRIYVNNDHQDNVGMKTSANLRKSTFRRTNDVDYIQIEERKRMLRDMHSVEPSEPAIRMVEPNKLFECLLCAGDNLHVGDRKKTETHFREKHPFRIYICDVCGKDYRKRNDLSAHLDKHIEVQNGDFQCEHCNRIFPNLRLFRIHKRMHTPATKAYVCPVCQKSFTSRNILDEHTNTHTGNRPYKCEECGKDFASKYTWRAHSKTHSVRPRPYQCTACNKSFLNQANLLQHEKSHSGSRDFICKICEKTFTSSHNLDIHLVVHSGHKPFECSHCGKCFARKAEIRDHERIHTGERPFQCELCGATFSQRSNLQSHKRATHYNDKRYKCSMCEKAFKRRRLLDYHVKSAHTGERPFKCDACDATFVYPEHYKKHQRIHTGEKPYQCEICGKAFNSRDNRNAHRFIHSDKKPYECLVCGMGFMRKPFLYTHMKNQGHLNDTIVVNQPRLSLNDNDIVTVNEKGEMQMVSEDGQKIKITESSNLESSEFIIDNVNYETTSKAVVKSEVTTIYSEDEQEIHEIQIDEEDAEDSATDAILANGDGQMRYIIVKEENS